MLTRPATPLPVMIVLLAMTSFFSVISSATVKPIICRPNITEPNVPILYLGGVDLQRSCEIAISPKLHRCHTEYVDSVRQVFVEAKCYEGAESVKRAMCCSLWTAKECMVQAAEDTSECSANVTAAYRALPSSREEREHVLDQCSEYGEGVASCENIDFRSGSFLRVFIITLLVFLALPAIVFGAMKAHEIYQDYKTFQQDEANRKQGQQQLPLDSVDYSDDGAPLNEKIQYEPEDEEENNNDYQLKA